MVRKLTELLDQYDLRKKIIAYVKDEGTNLNAMTIALKSIVSILKFLVWRRVSKSLVLVMHFLKHVNMGQ